MNEITQEQVEQRIAGLDEETRKRMTCALVGHSRIVTTCFGYVYCARCDDQIGDTLGGIFNLDVYVIVGHACPTCRDNFERMNWRDTLLTPEPFPAAQASGA
ncbi:hypothetical protein DF053_08735 [Burkholderia cepacia]|uniref:hypothetical protein n=1 Tax=Burkholderia cepacia TaxID=292 RepID=UPI000F5FACA3|nr:hypothetical protein [Burkholderia cepacia]RQZ89920.1 hypothetical protein DF053_08735 [Burkholderia cepacia]